MDTFSYVLQALTPTCLWAMLVGVVGGTIIGALPGLTAAMGVALLVPVTFGMAPVVGLNMLIGIYIGGIYGGCISTILIKTPGTPASAATALDGYPMAQKGQAAKALGMATISSFIGGIFSSFVLAFMSPLLAEWALKFGPIEYFSMAVFGLTIIASLSTDILKGLIAGCVGILLTTVGGDPISGALRFTFGIPAFADGFAFIPALIGLFAISEVLVQVENVCGKLLKPICLTGSIPTLREVASCWKTLLRGSIIGTVVGIIPGTGAGTAAWISYSEAKRTAKHPEIYGTGCLDGVAATESANNAVCGGALVPLLALGIPGDPVTAVLIGGLMIHGLIPGPMLFQEHPEIVTGIFTASFVCSILMLVTGLIGLRFYAQILNVPKRILLMSIILFCCLGSFAINLNVVDMYTMLGFGIIGYIFTKLKFSLPAVCIALILGPIAEASLRQALITSRGDYSVLFTSPISVALLLLSVFSLSWPIWCQCKARKQAAVSRM